MQTNALMKRHEWLAKWALCGVLLLAAGFPAQAADPDGAPLDSPDAQSSALAPTDPATAPPQTEPTTTQSDATVHEQQTGTSNDRLFYALPNFLTVDDMANIPRLSPKEKFAVVARSDFDYVEFAWIGALAGISQAENSEPGYGQGLEGYGKRYGAAYADGSIESFMTSAVLASALRQDPRFYLEPNGSFGYRTTYAVSRIFITRGDSGRREFNFSEIFGSLIAAAISTYAYHPRPERTISNTASVWGSQVGYDTLSIEVKEFWPSIHHMISKKRAPSDPAAPVAPALAAPKQS
jgi:hypothetical protein